MRAVNDQIAVIAIEAFAAVARSSGGGGCPDAEWAALGAAAAGHVAGRDAVIDDAGVVAVNRGGGHGLVINLRGMLA